MTRQKMDAIQLDSYISWWRANPENCEQISALQETPAFSGSFMPFPSDIDPRLQAAFQKQGIERLYTHQYSSLEAIRCGQNVVISTGTASGKTLCYNLPVFDSILKDGISRALYIFPTKALAHDQLSNLQSIINGIDTNRKDQQGNNLNIRAAVYDGDTPDSQRSAIRDQCQILLTNPDMLHIAILPHHTLWSNFFQSLRFVIIDEMHLYRGVFGSNVANVIRRMKRIAHFYNSYPQFILTSATIANSRQLAERLIEQDCRLIDEDGSPHGKKTFFLYNPAIVHEELGIRKSITQETLRIGGDFLDQNLQTIIFLKTRRGVEIVLKRMLESHPEDKEKISGYRSGYLPRTRRMIEAGLREGEVKSIVATNALELGIDIGGMDCVILAGYPGTIASTRQQAGRAGRRLGSSAAVLIASANPLDQFVINHPEFIFDRSPEKAYINPDNLLILLEHLRSAAFELPFQTPLVYGNLPQNVLKEFLELLVQSGELFMKGGKYFWVADTYPTGNHSLRNSSGENIILEAIDEEQKSRIIGQVDQISSYWMVHPHAIYLQEGQSYEVIEYDLNKKKAVLKPSNVDYYTMPIQSSEVKLEELIKQNEKKTFSVSLGEICVTSQVTGYKKQLWETNEIISVEELEMPVSELHTVGVWLSLTENLQQQLRDSGFWSADRNNYGKNWDVLRKAIRARDGYKCQVCGLQENGFAHHVHHKVPLRSFTNLAEANRPDNLVTLCSACHQKAEMNIKIKSGLAGLAYMMHELAPIYTMCDHKDLGVLYDPQSALGNGLPTMILYDMVPAGIGLASQIYDDHAQILASCHELITACKCKDGCPGCVGPSGSTEIGGKLETAKILQMLLSDFG